MMTLRSFHIAISTALFASLAGLLAAVNAADNTPASAPSEPSKHSEPGKHREQSASPNAPLTSDARAPIVVEFFLSQACPACPAVAKDVKMFAGRKDLITLSWHVDYWDSLRDPKNGNWPDPFAKTVYTDRQTQYNDNIRGRPRNFTPQAVINGAKSVIAKNMGAVDKALAKASPLEADAQLIDITAKDETLAITIAPTQDEFEARLVYFQRATQTAVKGGLNSGVYFVDANVVYEMEMLALSETPAIRPKPAAGMGCAVLVQKAGQGPIHAARYCP